MSSLGTPCRLCRCTGYLPMHGRVGCACEHNESDHGPAFVQLPTGQRRTSVGPRSPPVRGGTRRRAPILVHRKYLVIIHAEPPYGTIGPTDSGDRFKDFRATTLAKVDHLIEQLQALNLCFTVECAAEDNEPAAPVIHHHLNLHFTQHKLVLESLPEASTSASANRPQWTFLMTQGRRVTALGAKLHPAKEPLESITHKMLYRNAAKICQPYTGHKLVYIVPTHNVIIGPLGGGGTHYCLALRGWNQHHTVNICEARDEIDCATMSCVLEESSEENSERDAVEDQLDATNLAVTA